MNELSRAASELLAKTRNEELVTEQFKRRMAKRVSQSLALGTVTAVTAEVEAAVLLAPVPVAPTLGQLVLSKLAALGTVVGWKLPCGIGIVLVCGVATKSLLAPTPVTVFEAAKQPFPPAEAPSGLPSETPAVLTNDTESAALPSAAASGAGLHAPPVSRTTLGLKDELAKLGEARRALSQGRAVEAIAIVKDYVRLFPKGALREEATATRIMAECSLGVPEGPRNARRFAQRSPDSPLGLRVSRACESTANTPSQKR
jgi:hypothetical protein